MRVEHDEWFEEVGLTLSDDGLSMALADLDEAADVVGDIPPEPLGWLRDVLARRDEAAVALARSVRAVLR